MARHTFDANGVSPILKVGSGGPSFPRAWGNFGGGTLTIQYLVGDDPNQISHWATDAEINWTETSITVTNTPAGVGIRFALDGAAAPNLTVEV